jgi:protein required for attachment to host cells
VCTERRQPDEIRLALQQAMSGAIKASVVIATPRVLGEMRKHYHKTLTGVLKGDIAKEPNGQSWQIPRRPPPRHDVRPCQLPFP